MKRETKPWDLEMDNTAQPSLACAMEAMIRTASHFTDAFRFDARLGRGISVFMRVHIPVGNEERFREIIGKRGELKLPPRPQLNSDEERQP